MKVAYLLGSLNRGGLETFMLGAFKNKNKADFDFVARFFDTFGISVLEATVRGLPTF